MHIMSYLNCYFVAWSVNGIWYIDVYLLEMGVCSFTVISILHIQEFIVYTIWSREDA